MRTRENQSQIQVPAGEGFRTLMSGESRVIGDAGSSGRGREWRGRQWSLQV